MVCQVSCVSGIARKNSLLNNLKQNCINIIRPAKGYVISARRKALGSSSSVGKAHPNSMICQSSIGRDDMVKVRSREEINVILDEWRKHKGCSFMDQMYDHCEKKYRVLKEINYFFDEVKQKMVKCRDIVILDGVTCSGKRTLYKEWCDRNCFLFWHKDWLDKIG